MFAEMTKKDNKILKGNPQEKSLNPFVIYADLGSLLKKWSLFHNNPKKSSTAEINKHTSSGYSMFTQCLFDATKNKLDCYRGKSCMFLREHATKIINYEEKEIIPLTYKENKLYK